MAFLKPGSDIPLKGKGSRLSPKAVLFVEYYLADPSLNASKAVVAAGYKTNNANRLATDLLRQPLVQRTIQEKTEKRFEKFSITQDYVLQKLKSIVEATEDGNPQAALRGLELLGKHLGLYRDRTEISGPDGEAIKMEQQVKEDVTDFKSRLARLTDSRGAGEVSEFPKPGSSRST